MDDTDTDDYYAVLGVARDATPDAVKSAWRAAAKAHHPDVAEARGKDVGAAAVRFKRAQAAWAILGDATRRREYDEARVRRARAAEDAAQWARESAQRAEQRERQRAADDAAARGREARDRAAGEYTRREAEAEAARSWSARDARNVRYREWQDAGWGEFFSKPVPGASYAMPSQHRAPPQATPYYGPTPEQQTNAAYDRLRAHRARVTVGYGDHVAEAADVALRQQIRSLSRGLDSGNDGIMEPLGLPGLKRLR